MTGFVYVLCLDPPRGIGGTDLGVTGHCLPIAHYVGWTGQDWPMHRAGGHGGVAGSGRGTDDRDSGEPADPPRLHGPYWQWTRKVAARTICRWLSPE
jgi:hypothetical protein